MIPVAEALHLNLDQSLNIHPKGLAFRMGQDLGFQRDPTHYDCSHMATQPPSFYFEAVSRRRLYWGSFITDK